MAPTRVTVSQRDGFTNAVYARTHELTSDEPADIGGADQGMTPWELVLAGMGSCTAITVQMYASRKEWDLKGVEVTLERDGDSGTVTMNVDIAGEFDEAQQARLSQVAERCPVVKAIKAGVPVEKNVSFHG